MAKVAAKNSRVWIDEHALSGYLSGADLKMEQETILVEDFLSAGPERLVGNYDHMLSLNGFFDAADDAFDPVAFVDLMTDEDHQAFVTFGAGAVGSVGYEGPVRLKSQPRSAAVGQAVLLNIETEGAGPIARSTILHTGAITATGDQDGQNLGATSSGDLLVVVYRVLAVSGSGSIVMQIHESSDDGGSDAYASIAALASGTLTGVGATRKTTTAATEAYKRLTVSTFSGFTSATVLVTIGVAKT